VCPFSSKEKPFIFVVVHIAYYLKRLAGKTDFKGLFSDDEDC